MFCPTEFRCAFGFGKPLNRLQSIRLPIKCEKHGKTRRAVLRAFSPGHGRPRIGSGRTLRFVPSDYSAHPLRGLVREGFDALAVMAACTELAGYLPGRRAASRRPEQVPAAQGDEVRARGPGRSGTCQARCRGECRTRRRPAWRRAPDRMRDRLAGDRLVASPTALPAQRRPMRSATAPSIASPDAPNEGRHPRPLRTKPDKARSGSWPGHAPRASSQAAQGLSRCPAPFEGEGGGDAIVLRSWARLSQRTPPGEGGCVGWRRPTASRDVSSDDRPETSRRARSVNH